MNKNTVPFTGRTLRGELALLVAVCINSLGVVLMLYSGAGISAISSVPFAFSEVFPKISRQEAGCLQYDYCVSEENPDQILLTEQWATEAQQQAHLKQPHMQRQQQIKQACIAETTVEKC